MKLAMLGPVGLAVILQRISAETSPQLPQVPKVFNAGPDGMPQLPHVEELLKDYQEVKQHLESETSSLTEHLSQVETSGLDEIGKQKEFFDQKLREQEKENAALVRSNSHLAKEIIAARQENAKMKKEVAHKEKLMSFRQNQVRGLEQQLVRSQKFFQQVMNDTAFNKPGEAVKLEDEAELPELDAVSFLEVSKRSHKAKKSLRSQLPPDAELVLEAADEKANRTMDESEEVVSASKEDEQIIASLTQDLQKLRKAQAHSRKLLKTSFDQSFEAGKRRQEALKKQESVLTEELKSTQAAGQQLQAESQKLQSALDQMESKLKRGGNLFGKLQQVASAPVKDAELEVA